MLGRLLTDLIQPARRRSERAFAAARAARESGDWPAAVDHLRSAVAASPRFAEAHNDLGVALCSLGRFAEALAAYENAAACAPAMAAAHLNLGHLHRQERRDYDRAIVHYRAALNLDAALAEAWNGLGLAWCECGQADQALGCFAQAMARAPGDAAAYQYALFARNAVPRDHGRHYEEHLRWARRFAEPVERLRGARARSGGKLRVGYVSGDFREHATARFLMPVLRHHDRRAFEIVCYQALPETDAVTVTMRALVDRWREIHALDDAAAAAQIRDDSIDILVDLSGHTRGNRLGVFARKPAPVQVGYLGYLNTTGMSAMDFRLTDAAADPPESDGLHRERLLRLPRGLWCYAPPGDAPDALERPPSREIVFGSLNHPLKLHRAVLETWAELLGRVQSARLVIAGVPEGSSAAALREPFAERRIAPERIEILGRRARADYYAMISGFDIALDAFPYNGGSTTCDALWMGVPVVTLAGRFGFARSGATILAHCGLEALVAGDRQEYLRIASDLAADCAGLRGLRAGMRERLRASPLMDASGFVRQLEAALQAAASEVAAATAGP